MYVQGFSCVARPARQANFVLLHWGKISGETLYLNAHGCCSKPPFACQVNLSVSRKHLAVTVMFHRWRKNLIGPLWKRQNFRPLGFLLFCPTIVYGLLSQMNKWNIPSGESWLPNQTIARLHNRRKDTHTVPCYVLPASWQPSPSVCLSPSTPIFFTAVLLHVPVFQLAFCCGSFCCLKRN